jgi:hypothetical protein
MSDLIAELRSGLAEREAELVVNRRRVEPRIGPEP